MDTQHSYTMQKTRLLRKFSLKRTVLLPLMFLIVLMSPVHQKSSSYFVSGAIVSVGEPDWSISKADLVDELYSYEPYEPGREFRSLFPFFRQPSPQQQQKQNNQQQQNQAPRKAHIAFPIPGPVFGTGSSSHQSNSYLPLPPVVQAPQSPQTNYQQPSPTPSVENKYSQSGQGQIPSGQQGQGQIFSGQVDQSQNKPQDLPTPPKYTKFSLTDKKTFPSARYGPPQQSQQQPPPPPQQQKQQPQQKQQQQLLPSSPELTDITTPKPFGPVYEHPTAKTTTITTTIQPFLQGPSQQSQPINQNKVYYPDSTATDSQTIIWPQNVEENLTTNVDDTQVRFLVHKAGDEDVIRSALLEDGANRNQDVKFIEGPMLRIQRHQKVYLPPKKKTVVYILLKEPQITTDVEVVGPTEEPAPEVFITYQKSDGAIRTKHYSPEVVKNDKYLSQLRTSATSALAPDFQSYDPEINNNHQDNDGLNLNGQLATAGSENRETVLHKAIARSINTGSIVDHKHEVPKLVLCPTTMMSHANVNKSPNPSKIV